MMDSQWNNLAARIRGEALRCNGKTTNAVAKVNVSVVIQQGSPIMWEVTQSGKLEPTHDIIESFAGVIDQLKQLSNKCGNPHRLRQVLQEAIDKL